jgi:hypothetical protein
MLRPESDSVTRADTPTPSVRLASVRLVALPTDRQRGQLDRVYSAEGLNGSPLRAQGSRLLTLLDLESRPPVSVFESVSHSELADSRLKGASTQVSLCGVSQLQPSAGPGPKTSPIARLNCRACPLPHTPFGFLSQSVTLTRPTRALKGLPRRLHYAGRHAHCHIHLFESVSRQVH